jgi:hypothetical protein
MGQEAQPSGACLADQRIATERLAQIINNVGPEIFSVDFDKLSAEEIAAIRLGIGGMT